MKLIAGADRIAHAHEGRRPRRTACGKPAIDERHAWPRTSICPECEAAIAAAKAASR